MAQTLERWRDRPEYRRLCELAAGKPLVADAPAAARELTQAIDRLLDAQVRGGRLEALIEKARSQGLDDTEKSGTSGTYELQGTVPWREGRRSCRLTALKSAQVSSRYGPLTLNFGSPATKFRYNCQLSHERAPLHPPFVASDEDGRVVVLIQLSPQTLLKTP